MGKGAHGILWALALSFSIAAARGVLALDLPNLSGTWIQNKDLSDDPQKKLQEARGSQGGGFRSGRGFGGGRGHAGGRSGDTGSGSDAGGAGNVQAAFEAMATLRIEHREPELRITDAGGHESVFFTDGRKTEEERSYGGTTKIQAQWKDGHVQVKLTPERGPRITNTYAVAKDSSQLILTTRLERGHGAPAVEIRLVYDRKQ